MTNPFQHAFTGQDASFLAGITGHSRARRPSYTSTHPATRANAFSNLLNPTLQYYTGPSVAHHHNIQSSSGSGLYQNQDPEPEQNGSAVETDPRRPWATRTTPLASSSRAFNLFMGGTTPAAPDSQRTLGLFIPSYLKSTVYAEKLEEQYRATQELKDGHGMGSQPTSSNNVGDNASGTTSSSSSSSSSSSNGANGATQNGKQSGSHRGVAFQIVERSPHAPEDRVVGELPTKWNRTDKASALEVSREGLEVKYTALRVSSERDHEAASIRADNPVPPACGIYYYEITILSKKREETTIGIGFASRKASINRLPGWELESWGYHGDDGHTFGAQSIGRNYGPRFTTRDTIGCGINMHTGCVFFTKNGVNMGTAFCEVKPTASLELFPAIGLKKTSEYIRANFGQSPFMFDIDEMMRSYKDKIWQQINNTSADNLVPGLDETDLVQALVLQYLQHDGYVETARAFSQESHAEKQDLCLDPNLEVEGPSMRDDEDATNRQAIRCAVLEGNIDRALELTNAHYPNVLKANEQVYFRLKCRKFIEMARKSAEINTRGERAAKRGQFGQHMELDNEDAIEDEDELYQETIDGGGSGKMGATTVNPDILLQEMLDYGQALQLEFADETRKEYKKALQEAFALIAYPNPLKVKEMAHLMYRKGRVSVAEELNSAILTSLGKSRRAPLENMWAQTEVLLDWLRPSGDEGAFVSLKDVVKRVPKNQPF